MKSITSFVLYALRELCIKGWHVQDILSNSSIISRQTLLTDLLRNSLSVITKSSSFLERLLSHGAVTNEAVEENNFFKYNLSSGILNKLHLYKYNFLTY
jgi:hypothetical protein